MDEEIAAEMKKALALPSCPFCGATITAQQKYGTGHCGAEPCFLAQISHNQKQLEDLRAQDYRERQDAARAAAPEAMAAAADDLGCETEDLVVAVFPFQNEPLEPVSEAERAAFAGHLDRVVDAALEVKPQDGVLAHYQQNTRAEPAIIDAGCAACQGFCCKRGGGENFAFITRQSVYYILQQQPDLSKEDVVSHFLDAVPQEHVREACLYQGAAGCTLEREWRAGLCNTFHCHDIFALHDVTGGRADVALVTVGIEDDTPGTIGVYDMDRGWRRLT